MIQKYSKGKTANKHPDRENGFRKAARSLFSGLPLLCLIKRPNRPLGISVYMRVKNEKDWIVPSVRSILSIADQLIIVDNGSKDGTYEMVKQMETENPDTIKVWRKSSLKLLGISNFALEKTVYRWVFRWDGDMVAHTTGEYNIDGLKKKILNLDGRRFYLVYLQHINLSGDLFHQDPKEMVHIEEYIHTFSNAAKFIHPGRFEAVKFPIYYKPLFWLEPYSFHVNVKSDQRMLFRYFWEDWMELKDYSTYPTLESYVVAKIEEAFGTNSLKRAASVFVKKALKDHIPYDENKLGPYPKLLQPYLKNPEYRILYEKGKIVGREQN